MRSRAIAASALLVFTLFAATGCNIIAPQATTIQYSPAEGVSVPRTDGAPVTVRNAMFIADETGTNANFVAAIINETEQSQELHIQIGQGETAIKKVAALGPRQTLALGSADTPPALIENLDVPAGQTVEVYFQSGSAPGVRVHVPVQSGDMEYFKDLVPGETVVLETEQ